MPHYLFNQLTDNEIKKFIKQQPKNGTTITDGDNLFLRMYRYKPYFTFRVRLKTNAGIKHTWHSIGPYPEISLAHARDKARGIRSLIQRGINPKDYKSTVEKLGKTFGEISSLFTKQHFANIKQSSITQWRTVMSRVQILNDVVMEKIIESDITDIMAKADNSGAKSIAAGLLQRTKMIFKWAKKEGYIPHDPVRDLERSYKIKPVERYLSPSELKHLFHSMANDNHTLALEKTVVYSLVVLLTRKEELLRLKWQDVDLETGRVVLRETKSINNFTLIIPQQVITLWSKLKQLNPISEYVFATKKSHYNSLSLRRDLNWMIDNYKMTKFTPHDFRRTGMTILAEQGYRHEVIDSALAHVQTGLKKHYQKSNLLEERRKLLQDWADYINSLLEQQNQPIGNNWLWFDINKL